MPKLRLNRRAEPAMIATRCGPARATAPDLSCPPYVPCSARFAWSARGCAVLPSTGWAGVGQPVDEVHLGAQHARVDRRAPRARIAAIPDMVASTQQPETESLAITALPAQQTSIVDLRRSGRPDATALDT